MKRLRKILIICFPILLVSLIGLSILGKYKIIISLPEWLMIILSGLLLIDILVLIIIHVSGKKFYNFSIWLILLLILGLIFRTLDWQGEVLIFLAGLIYILGLIAIAFRSIFVFKNNPYIQVAGFFASIITAISLVGLIIKIMVSGGGTISNIISITSAILYIIFIIALMFTLPNANYLKWTVIAKKFLYRSIIIPMLFLFILYTFVLVFPSIIEKLNPGQSIKELQMEELKLKDKEGI